MIEHLRGREELEPLAANPMLLTAMCIVYKDGLEYPWGNDWEDEIVNSGETGLHGTTPVGLFPPSRSKAYGLEDMAGNAWEWTDSFCDEEEFGTVRVLRGGGWFGGA
jgi:formylglycine-generating enzyme required for sulfatase activity